MDDFEVEDKERKKESLKSLANQTWKVSWFITEFFFHVV